MRASTREISKMKKHTHRARIIFIMKFSLILSLATCLTVANAAKPTFKYDNINKLAFVGSKSEIPPNLFDATVDAKNGITYNVVNDEIDNRKSISIEDCRILKKEKVYGPPVKVSTNLVCKNKNGCKLYDERWLNIESAMSNVRYQDYTINTEEKIRAQKKLEKAFNINTMDTINEMKKMVCQEIERKDCFMDELVFPEAKFGMAYGDEGYLVSYPLYQKLYSRFEYKYLNNFGHESSDSKYFDITFLIPIGTQEWKPQAYMVSTSASKSTYGSDYKNYDSSPNKISKMDKAKSNSNYRVFEVKGEELEEEDNYDEYKTSALDDNITMIIK